VDDAKGNPPANKTFNLFQIFAPCARHLAIVDSVTIKVIASTGVHLL